MALRPPEVNRDSDLSGLSTFGLPARSAELVWIDSPADLVRLSDAGTEELILGGGSNTLFVADYPGRIIVNRMRGVRFDARGDDVLVSAAAGENWHALVRRCLDAGLYGLENLVMIPGSVGAAPMQNIGAYGVELSDVFESLTALDRSTGEQVRLAGNECSFGYRDSRFKSADRDRFVITEVTLRLSKRFRPRIDYPSLAAELTRVGNETPTPRQLASAVMRLRRHRLPDPGRLANAGSFFKNPVVGRKLADELIEHHPELPHWPMTDTRVKLAAAWMLERLGWKGRRFGQTGVYANHALVLVNHGGATASDLLELVAAMIESVKSEFGLELEVEPNLVGQSSD